MTLAPHEGLALGTSPLWRPLAARLTGDVPVGDNLVPIVLMVSIVGASLAGGLAGVAVGMLAASRRGDGTARQVTSLNRRDRVLLSGCAVGIAILAFLIVRGSDGRLWFMVGGALLGSIAFACAGALSLGWIAHALGRSKAPMVSVAGRLLADDSRRWALGTAARTAFVGILATTFVYVTSSAAAVLPFMGSRVPAGVTALRIQDPEGVVVPPAIVEDFENVVGTSDPVLVREEHYWQGPVWTFSSITDLERVTGTLATELIARLEQGALISHKALREEQVLLQNFGGAEALATTVIPFTGAAVRGHAHASAFGLASQAPSPPNGTPVLQLVYTGLSPEANQRAGEWALERGLVAVEVLTYQGEAQASWPLWTSVSLAGFGLLVLVVASIATYRETASLRPLLGAFVALGLPRSWLRTVTLPLVLTFGGTCAIFALLGALYALGLLATTYRAGVFDAAGVPWWVLLTFLASIPLACALTGLLVSWGRVTPTLTQVE